MVTIGLLAGFATARLKRWARFLQYAKNTWLAGGIRDGAIETMKLKTLPRMVKIGLLAGFATARLKREEYRLNAPVKSGGLLAGFATARLKRIQGLV